MSAPMRGFAWLSALLLFVIAFALQWTGVFGWTLFVLVPAALGGLAVAIVPQRTSICAAGFGGVVTIVCTFALLAFGMEGLGCIIMALPLTAPLGALGGLTVHYLRTRQNEPRGAAMLMLLMPASLTCDLKSPKTEFKVHSEVVVAATPETVWKHVVTFPDLPDPEEWYFHTGLAYPLRARIVGSGPQAIRYCEFSTGSFVEPIEIWDQPRLLAFRVTENPPPMKEWSPYSKIDPKHLHGYLISKHGQFQLTPLPGGRTLLEGTTWYEHGLWPGEYWRWWSDAIIHRIHLRVLNHVKHLAESD